MCSPCLHPSKQFYFNWESAWSQLTLPDKKSLRLPYSYGGDLFPLKHICSAPEAAVPALMHLKQASW